MSDGVSHCLTRDLAARFASIALGHVTREYPNKLDHVLAGPHDLRDPRDLHPVFYGSFDWHSCVHGYWLLAGIYGRFTDPPEAARIRELFDAHLMAEKIAGELAYLRRPESRGFERPYGWAWLLALAAELSRHTTLEGRAWAAALAPLAAEFVARFLEFLPKAVYPVRAGTHGNTAFAAALAYEYAQAAGDERLALLLTERARRWYGNDVDCPAWEPSLDDFLSPALVEATCMRRILPAAEFPDWLERFLPRLRRREPATLFEPAVVSDRSDGKIVHLDGLNLSRAWCWREIASGVLDAQLQAIALAAADHHFHSALPHVAGDYMGEHWLATFAMLALLAGS